MKKLLIILVFALMIGTLHAQDMQISGGVNLAVTYQEFGTSYTNVQDYEYNIMWALIDVGVFVDFTYGVFIVNYTFSAGDMLVTSYKIDGSEDEIAKEAFQDPLAGVATGNISLILLGKYPFDIGVGVIFPALGAEYRLNVSYERTDPATDDKTDLKDSYNSEQNASLNDFFLLAGCGADFNLSDDMYFRALALFVLNLTPDRPDTVGLNDPTNSHWGVKVEIGVGLRF